MFVCALWLKDSSLAGSKLNYHRICNQSLGREGKRERECAKLSGWEGMLHKELGREKGGDGGLRSKLQISWPKFVRFHFENKPSSLTQFIIFTGFFHCLASSETKSSLS